MHTNGGFGSSDAHAATEPKLAMQIQARAGNEAIRPRLASVGFFTRRTTGVRKHAALAKDATRCTTPEKS